MSKSANANQLLNNAANDGTLSPAAMNALQVVDLGADIQAGLGVSVGDIQESEVVLLTIMPDDSGSISSAGNEQEVRDGHNLIIEAMKEAKQKDNIFAHNRYLNGKLLYPYSYLDKAIKMDGRNYRATGGTPLYDQTVLLLGTVIAKSQEFLNKGVTARTITLIVTDGEDVHSKSARPAMVKSIVDDMLKEENNIIAAMGIGNNTALFRKIFKEMGIRDQWILTPRDTKSEIRKAFQVFSQSAVRASKSAGNFSKTAIGGFGS